MIRLVSAYLVILNLMKRVTKKRVFLSLLLIFSLAIACGVVYLNKVYLPVKIKSGLTAGLEEALHYNVDISGISFSLINGIVIQDIFIYDKIKDRENTILKINRASFHLLYLPLLKEQRIIIPVLHIYSPDLTLRYRKDNTLNISRIFSQRQPQPEKQKSGLLPLIYKINILRGNIIFEDEREVHRFSKAIHNLNIGASVRELKVASFIIHGNLSSAKEGPAKILLEGDYNFKSGELLAKLNLINLNLAEFGPYLKMLPFSVSAGRIENTNLTLRLKNKDLRVEGEIYTKGFEAKKEELSLSADMDILPQLSYAIETRALTYKLGFRFNNSMLSGIKYIGNAYNIKGALELTKDKLNTDSLKFQALDSDFTLSGSLEDFINPYLKINLDSPNLKLEKSVLFIKYPAGINLAGIARGKIELSGRLKELPLKVNSALIIEEARLEAPLLKGPLQQIKGKVNLENDAASWQELSFGYQGTVYTSSGRLTGFLAPQLDFKINSKELSLTSDIKISTDLITLNNLSAGYINSDCSIKGAIQTREKNKPFLDLDFVLNLNPSDILALLPKGLAEQISKVKPQGTIRLSGKLSGPAKDYRDWSIQAQGKSEAFSVYNLRFSNLSFNLFQQDELFHISEMAAASYSGAVNIGFVSNLQPEPPTYALKFSLLGVDLGQLKSDTGLKDKDISGILNIEANLVGNFKEGASLKGSGNLVIENGKLWKINLLKGLGELFLISDYEKIVFKEARAGFNIENKGISTEDLQLISDQLKLDCQGSLGFDGSLNFIAYAQVNKELIRESSDLRKFTAAILGELGNAVSIKIGGTIQKPKYHLVPIPLDLIKRVKDFFLGK